MLVEAHAREREKTRRHTNSKCIRNIPSRGAHGDQGHLCTSGSARLGASRSYISAYPGEMQKRRTEHRWTHLERSCDVQIGQDKHLSAPLFRARSQECSSEVVRHTVQTDGTGTSPPRSFLKPRKEGETENDKWRETRRHAQRDPRRRTRRSRCRAKLARNTRHRTRARRASNQAGTREDTGGQSPPKGRAREHTYTRESVIHCVRGTRNTLRSCAYTVCE